MIHESHLLRIFGLAALVLASQRIVWSQGPASDHSSDHSGSIAVPGTGNAKCLRCHDSIAAVLNKKVVHPAVELGCNTCHIDHQASNATTNQPSSKTSHYLVASPPGLCLTCHAKDEKLTAVHHGQPFEMAACTGCHNPHASDNSKLIAAHEHPPFAQRQCELCHQQPEDGKVKFKAASVSELCESCHTAFRERFDKSKVKHTFLAASKNSCITCHRPHATAEPEFLKARVVSLCTTCHVDKPGKRKFVHAPALENCAICHDPHSSDFHVHLKADVNTVCLACHGVIRPTRNSEGEPLVMPAGFPEKASKISLNSQGMGHPYIGHPVSGPGINAEKDKPLSCISCHNPHSGNVVEMFQGELRGTALCLSCHGKK